MLFRSWPRLQTLEGARAKLAAQQSAAAPGVSLSVPPLEPGVVPPRADPTLMVIDDGELKRAEGPVCLAPLSIPLSHFVVHRVCP